MDNVPTAKSNNVNFPEALKAVVHRIYDGPHGPYALALPQDSGPINKLTFSLEATVWKEERRPEQGEVVYVSLLVEKRAGWQSREARFWSTNDEGQRIKNLPLEAQLAYYAEKSKTYSGKSNVIIELNSDIFTDFNRALSAMDEEEKIQKICEIFNHFCLIQDSCRWEFNGQIIGLTLSADHRRLRAWRGFPEIILSNHAEGKNYLMEITGQKESVEIYLCTLLKQVNLKAVSVPNGMSLYLNWQ
jgi:hypothetical protein